MSLRDDAIWNLTEKLRDGKQVGRCTFRDLIDCEVNSERYRILLEEFDTLLCGEGGSDTVEGFASRMRDGIIERYLSTPQGEELIRQEIADILHEEPEIA